MKPLTSCILKVRVKNLDNEEIEKVQFLFRTSKSRNSKKITEKLYSKNSTDVTYDIEDKCYSLHFKPDETDLFPEDSIVWLDIRPSTSSGNIIPVELVKIEVTSTLFTRSDVDDS